MDSGLVDLWNVPMWITSGSGVLVILSVSIVCSTVPESRLSSSRK